MARHDDLEDAQPMLSSLGFSERRPQRDVSWKWTFAVFLTLAVVGGIYAGVHRNPDFGVLISSDYLADPAHCPAAPGPSRRLLSADDKEKFKPTRFLQAAGLCTGVSVAGGLVVGLVGLWAIKARPQLAVGLAVGLQVLLPAAAGVAVLVASGSLGGAAPLLVLAGGMAFVFYLYRDQLALVGRLLGVAGAALVDNPSIVGGSLLLQAAGLLLALPLAAFMLLAFTNGGVGRNPAVAGQEGSACLDGDGRPVPCCAWLPDRWAVAYISLTALVLGWCSLLVFTMRVFVVSGVTAQWYFAPAHRPAPRGALSRSLGYALGPSFGSLCLASWLLNLLQMLKSAAESARSDNRDNVLLQLLLSCFELLISVLEAVTKFSVVSMAITGDGLMDACRKTSALLRRNLLDTVGVWWFPSMILGVTALLLSGIWAVAVGAASWAAWGRSDAALSSGIALGALSFVFALATISFLNGVLLNIVDAVYICWALEKDSHGPVSRPEVASVYAALPSNKAPPGGLVEQPDGGVAFAGGLAAQQPPGGYPPVQRV